VRRWPTGGTPDTSPSELCAQQSKTLPVRQWHTRAHLALRQRAGRAPGAMTRTAGLREGPFVLRSVYAAEGYREPPTTENARRPLPNLEGHREGVMGNRQHRTVRIVQCYTVQYCAPQHNKLQYSRVQYSTVHHSTAQHSTAQHSTAKHSTAQHSTAKHSTAQHSTAQHSTAQHSTAQHSTAQHSTAQHRSTAQYSTVQYSTEYSTVEYSTVQYLVKASAGKMRL